MSASPKPGANAQNLAIGGSAVITVVGLGPGDPGQLTQAAWATLSAAKEIYVRTAQHPTLAALPPGLVVHSFDAVYAATERFADVYEQMVSRLIEQADSGADLIYALPGDPAVGETTTALLRARAAAAGIDVQVIHGVSFIEPTCLALGLDPLDVAGLQVLDAMVVAMAHAPGFDTARPALLAQCYSRTLAGDVKLTLLHSLPPDHLVTVVQAAGTTLQALRTLPLYELDRSGAFDHLTSLYVPPVGAYASFTALQEIVAHLRAPDGCPWDREQTLQTLRKDLLEETYELLEALDADDDAAIAEELGDVVMGLTLIAQVGAEEERFLWPAVMEAVNRKLIRRHPHVFGDVTVSGVEEVLENWAAIKAAEGGDKAASLLASVPKGLPALALAAKYQSRLQRAGHTVDLAGADPLGRALWQLVAEARAADAEADAETALRVLCAQVAAADLP